MSGDYRHPHLSRIDRAIAALTAERARIIDTPPQVAFQGAAGAFSEQAARLFFAEAATLMPMRTLDDVFAAMDRHEVEFAVVPVENTLAGAVPGCLAAIRKSGANVIGERILRIAQAAIGVPGATLLGARAAKSHPVALLQCAAFFAEHPHVKAESTYDTPGAVDEIMRLADPTVIAIAGLHAARQYGAVVLMEEVQDIAANFTRFVLLEQGSAR